MNNLLPKKLKDIVLDHPETVPLFEEMRIDYCCQGNKTLGEACIMNHLDPEKMEAKLIACSSRTSEDTVDFSSWDLDKIINYIINHHHSYIREMSPMILRHIRKVTSVHGENHPELVQISQALQQLLSELYDHIVQEEEILFPYLKQNNSEHSLAVPDILKPLSIMEEDHYKAGKWMNEIYKLTNGYKAPEDACTTYRLTFAELQEFEKQLHEHIYLENYLVFPKVVRNPYTEI